MNNKSIRKAILDWNPWFEGEFPKKLLGFEREIDILDYLKTKEIKILEGARRSGKSTLLYQVMYNVFQTNKNILYLNFDDELLKEHSLEEVYNAFLEKSDIDYLFVDEIQNCKNWVPFVRKLYDLKKIKQIWISGSNSGMIKKEYATLLTGRNISIFIHNLSFREFLHFRKVDYRADLLSTDTEIKIKREFSRYLKYGAFPEVALRDTRRKELLINYHDDFLYKDIVVRYGVNVTNIRELSLFLHSNNTKKVSYRNLSEVLDLHYDSVKDYLSYFSEIFLFSMIYNFDYSLKKQLRGQKKFYSLDTGLANAVSFKFSEDYGRVLESIVFSELKRKGGEVYYHSRKFECDFVVKKNEKILEAIQVTQLLHEKNREREVGGAVQAAKFFDLTDALILTEDQEDKFVIDGVSVVVIPVWKWLLVK